MPGNARFLPYTGHNELLEFIEFKDEIICIDTPVLQFTVSKARYEMRVGSSK